MKKAGDLFGLLSLILFVITVSLAFVIFFTPLYRWSALHLNVPENLGMSREVLFNNYRILMDYLTKPWINELAMPDFPSSPSGLFHFYEVKRLFLLNNVMLVVSTLGSAWYLFRLKRTSRVWTLIRPFFFLMFAPIVVLVMIMLNFDALFVLFHQLAFNNDMWIFNPATDPIILALPQEFFMYCFIIVFLLIELQFFAGYQWSRRTAFPHKEKKQR